jgi:hypothetical protein
MDILASLVHPRGGRRWRNRFVMMEAYFDESGIHDGAKVCVVAGYYGTQIAWRKFEGQWNKVLLDYPEIKGEGFHAKRFFGRDDKHERLDGYVGWSDDKANKFLERLIQCTLRNRIFPIGYAIVVDDFLALPLESRQWFTGAKFSKPDGKLETSGCPSKPYYLPFQFCALKSAQLSNAEKVHYFVGIDRTFQGYAAELYKFLMIDDRIDLAMRERLGGTLLNPPAKETPGLQAADLLANRIYRAALAKLADPNSPDSKLLLKLLTNWKATLRLRLMNAELFSEIEKAGRVAYEKMIREQGI